MFGAGLIKLRGDPCWRDYTCLFYHYETQPLPNPLSWCFHWLPKGLLSFGVLVNHGVELLVPFAYFAPQPLCALAGISLRDLVNSLPESGATRFTLAQERVLAADRPLAFLFFAILNGAHPDEFEREFRMPAARVEAYVQRLVKLGLLDQAPSGRIRPLTTRSVSWRSGGPLAAAFDKQIKHFFLSMDFGAPDAVYVSDMVRLSEAGRSRVHAMYAALRLEIHKAAEADRAAQLADYEWTAVLMLVQPLDMAAVRRIDPVRTAPI